MTNIHSQPVDEDTPTEIDFSQGARGMFFQPELKLNLPVYLDEDVQKFLATIAEKKGVQITRLVPDEISFKISHIDMCFAKVPEKKY